MNSLDNDWQIAAFTFVLFLGIIFCVYVGHQIYTRCTQTTGLKTRDHLKFTGWIIVVLITIVSLMVLLLDVDSNTEKGLCVTYNIVNYWVITAFVMTMTYFRMSYKPDKKQQTGDSNENAPLQNKDPGTCSQTVPNDIAVYFALIIVFAILLGMFGIIGFMETYNEHYSYRADGNGCQFFSVKFEAFPVTTLTIVIIAMLVHAHETVTMRINSGAALKGNPDWIYLTVTLYVIFIAVRIGFHSYLFEDFNDDHSGAGREKDYEDAYYQILFVKSLQILLVSIILDPKHFFRDTADKTFKKAVTSSKGILRKFGK